MFFIIFFFLRPIVKKAPTSLLLIMAETVAARFARWDRETESMLEKDFMDRRLEYDGHHLNLRTDNTFVLQYHRDDEKHCCKQCFTEMEGVWTATVDAVYLTVERAALQCVRCQNDEPLHVPNEDDIRLCIVDIWPGTVNDRLTFLEARKRAMARLAMARAK